METFLTNRDRKKIQKAIHKKYKKAAKNPAGLFKYPTGRAGLEALQYDAAMISTLPQTVTDSYCGVGNPFALGPVIKGHAILDIGCGSGVDAIFAAMMTGPGGKVVGIDAISEMLQRAKENLSLTGLKNITFKENSAEALSFEDQEFDLVISNGVFNLVPCKSKALSEAFRVLKPGGRLMIADQVLTGQMFEEKKQIIKSWSRWEGGAIPGKDFLALIEQAGFKNAEMVAKTGFNSSAKTEGVLIRARKIWICASPNTHC